MNSKEKSIKLQKMLDIVNEKIDYLTHKKQKEIEKQIKLRYLKCIFDACNGKIKNLK